MGCGAGFVPPPPLPPPVRRQSSTRIVLIAVGSVLGVMLLIAIVSAALFLMAGPSVKDIWQQSEAELRRAEQSPGTPEFDSVEALIGKLDQVKGQLVRVHARVGSVKGNEMALDLGPGVEADNLRVVCRPTGLNGVEEGQRIRLVAVVPAGGFTQVDGPTSAQSRAYELALIECRIE